ncbi:FtsB family cell division protein [Salinactinospora qingdaonensis]|uniref:FtsB family cell division protein n=1 Tax=Salinactinospora qingdaonensis TaxID=702744 RepID=UPI0031E8DE4A
MCVIALSLAYPLREYIAQRAEITRLQEELSRTRGEVEDLQQRYDRLQDPGYVERLARTRLHYQYPGEHTYVVLGAEEDDAEQPEADEPADPWFTQLWKSVREADRAAPDTGSIPEAQAPAH